MPFIDGPNKRFVLNRTRLRNMRAKYRDIWVLRVVIKCHAWFSGRGGRSDRTIAARANHFEGDKTRASKPRVRVALDRAALSAERLALSSGRFSLAQTSMLGMTAALAQPRAASD